MTALAATPKKIARLASRLGSKGTTARPAEDKWSAREIICHLADCEIVYGMRYRKILAEPGTALVAFDQERWAEGLQYRTQDLRSTLESFTALRAQHLKWLKSLKPEAWGRAGAHPEYGTLSLRQLVTHLADHDRNHTAQIERIATERARRRS
jgi:uncharacterized damage-inducible protein DinB